MAQVLIDVIIKNYIIKNSLQGGADRGRSRGLGHTKNQAPQESRPKNSREHFGKLARKIAYVKIPSPSIVISGLKEFHFVIILFP